MMSVSLSDTRTLFNTHNWICLIMCLVYAMTPRTSMVAAVNRVASNMITASDNTMMPATKPMPSVAGLGVSTAPPDTGLAKSDREGHFAHPKGADEKRGTGTLVKRLYAKLLDDYDVRIRPREDQSAVVNLSVMFYPINIVTFETATQTFSVLGFMAFSWTDDYLVWNRITSNVSVLKLPTHQVWAPSVFVYKPIDGSGLIGEPSDTVAVGNEGNVTWVPEGIFSAMCEVNIKYYPFDVQTCKISVYASDETADTVDLIPKGIGISDEYVMPSSEWKIIGLALERRERFHTVMIDYIFMVERRTSFPLYTMIAPIVLLSLLNLFIPLIPTESGEKVSAAVTLFLAYGVLVTSLSSTLPNNSLQASYLMTYILMLLSFSVVTALYSIVQERMSAYMGGSSVNLPACMSKNRSKDYGEDGKGLPAKPVTVTWSIVFRAADIAVFTISAVVLFTATIAFYASMQNNY